MGEIKLTDRIVFVPYRGTTILNCDCEVLSGVTTDPADPAMRGGAAGLRGPEIMALVFFTVNLTQQFCADVH